MSKNDASMLLLRKERAEGLAQTCGWSRSNRSGGAGEGEGNGCKIDGALKYCFQPIMVNKVIDVLIAIVPGHEEGIMCATLPFPGL